MIMVSPHCGLIQQTCKIVSNKDPVLGLGLRRAMFPGDAGQRGCATFHNYRSHGEEHFPRVLIFRLGFRGSLIILRIHIGTTREVMEFLINTLPNP